MRVVLKADAGLDGSRATVGERSSVRPKLVRNA